MRRTALWQVQLSRLPEPQLLSNFPALAAYSTSLHYAELLRAPEDEG